MINFKRIKEKFIKIEKENYKIYKINIFKIYTLLI
jgi:hypothetical protein